MLAIDIFIIAFNVQSLFFPDYVYEITLDFGIMILALSHSTPPMSILSSIENSFGVKALSKVK